VEDKIDVGKISKTCSQYATYIYPTKGHSWVCDGFRRSNISTETTIAYLKGNPNRFIKHPIGSDYGSVTAFLYFRYNWGHRGAYDGWFGYLNFKMTEGYDYKHKNENIFNIKP